MEYYADQDPPLKFENLKIVHCRPGDFMQKRAGQYYGFLFQRYTLNDLNF